MNWFSFPLKVSSFGISFFLLLFVGLSLHARQPAYFMLAESQFKGIQVYDVMQDRDLNYWFATNEGMYKYDCYKYEKVKCNEAKSASVFNFIKDSKGTIYCHNLNRQVFRIKDGKYELFYELREDENYPDISLSVSSSDELLIGAKKVIVLDEKGLVKQRYNTINRFSIPIKTDEGIIYHLSRTNSLLIYSNNKFNIKTLTIDDQDSKIVELGFFSIKKKLFALDIKTKEYYELDLENFILQHKPQQALFSRSGSVRLYCVGDKTWVAGTLPGIALLGEDPSQGELYYDNLMISDVYKDHEGNILLSTFDKGILVIPDLSIPDVIFPFKEDPIVSMRSDGDYGLLLGSSKGQLMRVRGDSLELLNKDGKRPLSSMYSKDGEPLIIFDNGYIRAWHKQQKKVYNIVDASLKDAVSVNSKLYYFATNRGILKIEWVEQDSFKKTWLKSVQVRSSFVEYDAALQLAYAATVDGLFSIDTAGNYSEIMHKGEDIFVNDLCMHADRLYIASKKGGLLVLQNNKIVDFMVLSINGKLIDLYKIKIYNETILAKTEYGLLQFSMQGEMLRQMNKSYGFSTTRIIDFDFNENQLWVSHYGGLQQINIERFYKKNDAPLIKVSKLRVNEQERDLLKNGQFTSAERKIQFTLSSPTLRNRDNIRYYYKLQGYDKEWILHDYDDNEVLYNALAAGDYVFLVKAENQGVFSETLSYSFVIATPFYLRWWFIAANVALFFLLVWLVYRRQLAIQRKKAEQLNELNASRLTAIQSQMNPHFIFNSLNSIQDLVLKGDVENSYSYITKFSNLVRRTLSYSEKDFIDFDEEIKLIELYLSLEKLRFKKELDYTLETNEIDDIQVPPMLVQPFIENALVHGLLHKEGAKKLSISFEMENEDSLICTIIDNGIGRERARAIKQRQGSTHESFAVKAIERRFEILKNHFNGNLGFEYEDLYENGEALGTKVKLRIPVKQRF